MTVLSELSAALAASVEAAGASIVRVEARRRFGASGVVWSADGVIVTAHHVVRSDERIRVGLPDDAVVSASLVGRDSSLDVAVLRVEAAGLTPARWLELEGVRVGHPVLALGRPGRTVQATFGVISALGEEWRTMMGGKVERYLQTDVLMYPGFSGGPLAGVEGQFIGMNTSGLLRGVSVALPAVTLRRTVQALLSYGRVRRGYLGVGAQAVQVPADLVEQLGQEQGLLLVSVEADGPAARAGLFVGDIIVRFAGQPTGSLHDLLAALGDEQVGETAAVRVVRGGGLRDMQVIVGERE